MAKLSMIAVTGSILLSALAPLQSFAGESQASTSAGVWSQTYSMSNNNSNAQISAGWGMDQNNYWGTPKKADPQHVSSGGAVSYGSAETAVQSYQWPVKAVVKAAQPTAKKNLTASTTRKTQ